MGQQLLARDVVRYVGEPVAVVVTEGRYQGEDAADLVDVDYDVLPPVIDMTDAANAGPPCSSPPLKRRCGQPSGNVPGTMPA